jgi:hypothetical protein
MKKPLEGRDGESTGVTVAAGAVADGVVEGSASQQPGLRAMRAAIAMTMTAFFSIVESRFGACPSVIRPL